MGAALSDDEVRRLEALGVKWDTSRSEQWQANLGLLKAFQRREGQCDVPSRHVEAGVGLGIWLSKQRKRYKARSTTNESERKVMGAALSDDEVWWLEALGVKWDASRSEEWEVSFGFLKSFQRREGNCDVPHAHIEGGERLGRWLAQQRKRTKHAA